MSGVLNPLELELGEEGGTGKNSGAQGPAPDQQEQNLQALLFYFVFDSPPGEFNMQSGLRTTGLQQSGFNSKRQRKNSKCKKE